jgi:hypothetical protein
MDLRRVSISTPVATRIRLSWWHFGHSTIRSTTLACPSCMIGSHIVHISRLYLCVSLVRFPLDTIFAAALPIFRASHSMSVRSLFTLRSQFFHQCMKMQSLVGRHTPLPFGPHFAFRSAHRLDSPYQTNLFLARPKRRSSYHRL